MASLPLEAGAPAKYRPIWARSGQDIWQTSTFGSPAVQGSVDSGWGAAWGKPRKRDDVFDPTELDKGTAFWYQRLKADAARKNGNMLGSGSGDHKTADTPRSDGVSISRPDSKHDTGPSSVTSANEIKNGGQVATSSKHNQSDKGHLDKRQSDKEQSVKGQSVKGQSLNEQPSPTQQPSPMQQQSPMQRLSPEKQRSLKDQHAGSQQGSNTQKKPTYQHQSPPDFYESELEKNTAIWMQKLKEKSDALKRNSSPVAAVTKFAAARHQKQTQSPQNQSVRSASSQKPAVSAVSAEKVQSSGAEATNNTSGVHNSGGQKDSCTGKEAGNGWNQDTSKTAWNSGAWVSNTWDNNGTDGWGVPKKDWGWNTHDDKNVVVNSWVEEKPNLTEQVVPKQDAAKPHEKKAKWRPRDDWDWDSQSLPETVSSIAVDNDEDDKHNVCHSDVRGQIADKMDLAKRQDGKMYNVTKYHERWNGTPEKPDWDEDEEFRQSWRPKFCEAWAAMPDECPPPVVWAIKEDGEKHEDCDIDTFSGLLKAPIDYPETLINREELQVSEKLKNRRLQNTSQMAAIEMIAWRKPLYGVKEPLKAQQRPAPQPQVSSAAQQLGTGHAIQGQNVVQHTILATQPQPLQQAQQEVQMYGPYLKIPCFLRPIQQADLCQLLPIYNWEVENGIQGLDLKPLEIEDFSRIWYRSLRDKTPFVVAVEGTAAEHEERRRRICPYVSAANAPPRERVLGFGFISIASTGLSGDGKDSVGHCYGTAHVYVAPESRRKGVGRALLARLAHCCSGMSVWMEEYEWVNRFKDATCEKPAVNPHDFIRITVEVASEEKTGAEETWWNAFLNNENFDYVTTMENARMRGTGRGTRLLHTHVWALECQQPENVGKMQKYTL